MNRFQFVADHSERHSVKRLCQVIGLNRSSFYYWKTTAADRARRDVADRLLAARIRMVHAETDGTYGAPRITAELREQGTPVNHKRVARIMTRFGVQGLRLRRRTRTTIPDPAAVKAPDLIGRDFTAPSVNQRYVGDITYLPIGERGFLYLATMIDLHSRRLAGWAIADHMRTELVADALKNAAATTRIEPSAIWHSNRGSVYTSTDFRALVTGLGMRSSMGRTGVCWDNSMAESFFSALKNERVYRTLYASKSQARSDLIRCIEGLYNSRRRHSALGYRRPNEVHYGYQQPALAA